MPRRRPHPLRTRLIGLLVLAGAVGASCGEPDPVTTRSTTEFTTDDGHTADPGFFDEIPIATDQARSGVVTLSDGTAVTIDTDGNTVRAALNPPAIVLSSEGDTITSAAATVTVTTDGDETPADATYLVVVESDGGDRRARTLDVAESAVLLDVVEGTEITAVTQAFNEDIGGDQVTEMVLTRDERLRLQSRLSMPLVDQLVVPADPGTAAESSETGDMLIDVRSTGTLRVRAYGDVEIEMYDEAGLLALDEDPSPNTIVAPSQRPGIHQLAVTSGRPGRVVYSAVLGEPLSDSATEGDGAGDTAASDEG